MYVIAEMEFLLGSSHKGIYLAVYAEVPGLMNGSSKERDSFFFFFFFGCTHSLWKFPGQKLNPCHSSDTSPIDDNTISLTC